jgi:hypothetical protein
MFFSNIMLRNQDMLMFMQLDITRQINSTDSKTLNKKKNDDYSKFLDITNRKSAIFRDIIIESECTCMFL